MCAMAINQPGSGLDDEKFNSTVLTRREVPVTG